MSARRRVWEVAPRHHCVLLGAAFDARELRGMFRRGGYRGWDTCSDYELHSSAVCCAKERSPFSILAQKVLERRYHGFATRFAAARSGEELLALWREAHEQGETIGAYWAALTHPAWDPELDEALNREMHMVAHGEFAARRAVLRRLRAVEAGAAQQSAAMERAQRVLAAVREENRRLREALAGAEQGAARAGAELARWRSGEAARAAQARAAELEDRLAAARAEAAAAQRALREAQRRAERAAARPSGAEPAARSLPEPVAAAPLPLPLPDLQGRRVLCIGGRTSLVAQYRAVIEDARGEFEHHDGGREDHVGRLPALLAAADAVVCLTGDCSHCAYRLAKRYCKAKGKPCALIGSSGVTTLSRTLVDGLGQAA